MELANRITFDQIVHIMNIATFAKIQDAVTSVRWSWPLVREAFSNINMRGNILAHFNGKRKVLADVYINCEIGFAANEVPGIITPFVCTVEAQIKRNEKTRIREIKIKIVSKTIIDRWCSLISYDIESLCEFFASYEAADDLSEFISDEFDFQHLCKIYNLDNIAITEANVPLMY